jgi:Histidine kinase-, DNA gyrase B-, and HSP90-like ATPase
MSPLIGEQILAAGAAEEPLEVSLSHELVTLLSEQLYQSPMKAIEELVVNSFDADAAICRLAIPDVLDASSTEPIIVYDDGIGMDMAGLEDLWHIGHSHKRDEQIETARKRKQIGKFGIGKLATYSIARQITYITRAKGAEILTTSLNFNAFKPDPTGAGAMPVKLEVSKLTEGELAKVAGLSEALKATKAPAKPFKSGAAGTVVLLEGFKPKAAEMKRGVLRWVLSTAMPMSPDFTLYLGGEEVVSSKAKVEHAVKFDLTELDPERVKALTEQTGEEWKTEGGALISDLFPSGVNGEVVVTKRTLDSGKSTDLQRSHGFFVRVRGRLVSIEDPLFGLKARSHKYFNRLHAEINADDLDDGLTAPREGVETTSKLRANFESLLAEVFNQARALYDEFLQGRADEDKNKREKDRNWVNPYLVEQPTADVLSSGAGNPGAGADADSTWFYLRTPSKDDLQEVLDKLYAERREGVYRYERKQLGESGRLVTFDPAARLFEINDDHEFARAHDADDSPLLEDVVTAEALLEVYLREEGIGAARVGEILERRDQLLRSLAIDRVYSPALIAQKLRDAIADADELEIAQVTACRAIGFVAKHVKDGGKPDGLARFIDYPGEEMTITLEAKSSAEVPELAQLDFAGLGEHVSDFGAVGCLLIAPKYPGFTKGDGAAAAKRAKKAEISCWTVDHLADIVKAAESRHIGARQVLEIVRTKFTPSEVGAAVKELLSDPQWSRRDLYCAIVTALRELEGRVLDRPRTMDQVITNVVQQPDLSDVLGNDVEAAIVELAGASKGALVVSEQMLRLNTSVDELETRVSALLGRPGKPRRDGSMRAS